jgi:excisionase family DNA binding protein
MEKFWNIKEMSEVLRISPLQVRGWARKGRIPCYKIAGTILFNPVEVEEYIRKTHRLEQKQSL